MGVSKGYLEEVTSLLEILVLVISHTDQGLRLETTNPQVELTSPAEKNALLVSLPFATTFAMFDLRGSYSSQMPGEEKLAFPPRAPKPPTG